MTAIQFEQDNPAILLVDDQEDILLFLNSLLQSQYRIHTAYDGKEACEILKSKGIHLVISDVMMPEMDGFELCDWMKSHAELSHIPLILLTAKDTMQSKIEGLKIGADAYIEKPFSAEHLKVQIENLLKNRTQLQAFYTKSPLAHLSADAGQKASEPFLEDIKSIIFDNLDNPDLDVVFLAGKMHVSRPTLYRKIKTFFHLSPNEMIHLLRLNKAAELIAEDRYRFSEIAEMVGYHSLGQFGRNFSKQFNMTPSEFLDKIRRNR
ncbi:response regulator transcription factor [Arachidicoccus terrestris]|uniref:response regulator transcription factor n=1 Tax=Arachidicoccus terrestris TaxID=2875539 RepID=UPI001CC71482|nr:response regulator [Arachidicoccus terrestris]UAY54899.1 response regulator [Arachidicoccus terrestris]